MPKTIPVLIVGAGPTGLTMAALLKRHEVPFRIIDKQTKPVVTSNALVVQTRTLEVWDDLDLLSEALAVGNIIHAFNFYRQDKKIAHIDFNLISGLNRFVLGISQHHTEKMLLKHLKKADVKVEMNVELINYKEKNDEIIATLRHPRGKTETVHAQWMIGCDGSHSFIRHHSKIAFNGKELEQHFVFADCKLKTHLAANEGHLFLSEEGLLALIHYDKNYFRIIAEVTDDPELKAAKSLSYEQVKRLVAKRCPFPLTISKPSWTSGFWIHTRIAGTYRLNKILLAGDAAHVHSPVGGQGMNTGIQDAYNLAWKLALVIQQKAERNILDSYYEERYPIAKNVLRDTTFLTDTMTANTPFRSAIRKLMIFCIARFKRVQKNIASTITEVGIDYKNSPLVKDCLSFHAGPRSGMRMIDVLYNGKKSLLDVVRGSQHALLIFSGKKINLNECMRLKATIKQKYPDIKFVLINNNNDFAAWDEEKIVDSLGAIHQVYGVKVASLYFIRPDKYIGFRGEMEHKMQLMDYLREIFSAVENEVPA